MPNNQKVEDERRKENWLGVGMSEAEIKILLHEHHELHEEILHRRRNTWFVISILLAGTFVVSFATYPACASIRYLLSLILVLFSWILWFSAQKVNTECWNDRHEIEDLLGIKMNQNRRDRLDSMTIHKMRKIWWHLLFLFLSLFYFHMLF